MSAAAAGAHAALPPPIRAGERCRRELRLTRQQIVDFAAASGDTNPLHHDTLAAQRAHFGEIIASGQHSAALLMGLAASHFSAPFEDGRAREMLTLNFNFAFKAPVFAEQALQLAWVVREVEPNTRRQGWIGHLDGRLQVAGRDCVIGRGTILVRPAG